MKQYFIVDKSILFMVPREDFTSPFSFLCSRAPQIFSALKSSVNLIHQHQHSPHTQPHIFQMWVPCMQDPIRHIWKCFSEVLGLQLVSHQELQVDPSDKNTCMFSGASVGKDSTCNAGDLGSIPGLGRFPRRRERLPTQYSGLENFMDCTVHGVAKSQT